MSCGQQPKKTRIEAMALSTKSLRTGSIQERLISPQGINYVIKNYVIRRLALSGMVIASLFGISSVPSLADCNIANVLFGKVRIDLISYKDYEVGIIFGNDFDSKRFQYGRILGQMKPPERDGSRKIENSDGEYCGVLEANLSLDREGVECRACSNAPVLLRRIDANNFVVMSQDKVMGTIEGRLPK